MNVCRDSATPPRDDRTAMETLMTAPHLEPDQIRTLFSRAMSEMYRAEVPQYGTLVQLVDDTNREILQRHSELRASLERRGELDRLKVERHGAVRLGSAEELFN